MNVSIFIRSFAGDALWLGYCLRTLAARAQGFLETVVACPVADKNAITGIVNGFAARLVLVDPVSINGYIDQQHTKCCADQYTTGDYVIYIDSDCLATRVFTPAEFFTPEGKPKLLVRPWAEAGDGICWQTPTRVVLGQEPPYETMCTHPAIYKRSTLQAFRNFIESRKGKPFRQYLGSLENFSEFNAVGNYIALREPGQYETVLANPPTDGYPRPLRQFWSHGGITPEIQAEIDQILANT